MKTFSKPSLLLIALTLSGLAFAYTLSDVRAASLLPAENILKYVTINPAPLAIGASYPENTYPLFSLELKNQSTQKINVLSLKVNLGRNWQIPNQQVFLMDSAQVIIGNLDNITFQSDSPLLKLDPGKSAVVTAVWQNNFFPKDLLKKATLNLSIPVDGLHIVDGNTYANLQNGNTVTQLSVAAMLPESIALGYRQAVLKNIITTEQNAEKITFVVNQELTALNPNWKNDAKKLIEAYNEIIAIKSPKRLQIEKYMVLSNADDICTQNLPTHPEYFYSNGSYGGLTIFYTVYKNTTTPSCNILMSCAGSTMINNQLYGTVFISPGYMDGVTYPNNPDSLIVLGHELGHAYGMSDWYLYLGGNYPLEDKTEVEPILHAYLPSFLNNYDDPMFHANGKPYSDFNFFLLNHNGNHRFTMIDYDFFLPDKIKVKVVSAGGKPVRNAEIKVFGMKRNVIQETYEQSQTQPLLQTIHSDLNGEASLPFPVTGFASYPSEDSGYLVYAVKASKDGKSAGAWYSKLDLQHALLWEGENIYTMRLVLQ